jgi:hypothetical protein
MQVKIYLRGQFPPDHNAQYPFGLLDHEAGNEVEHAKHKETALSVSLGWTVPNDLGIIYQT